VTCSDHTELIVSRACISFRRSFKLTRICRWSAGLLFAVGGCGWPCSPPGDQIQNSGQRRQSDPEAQEHRAAQHVFDNAMPQQSADDQGPTSSLPLPADDEAEPCSQKAHHHQGFLNRHFRRIESFADGQQEYQCCQNRREHSRNPSNDLQVPPQTRPQQT